MARCNMANSAVSAVRSNPFGDVFHGWCLPCQRIVRYRLGSKKFWCSDWSMDSMSCFGRAIMGSSAVLSDLVAEVGWDWFVKAFEFKG